MLTQDVEMILREAKANRKPVRKLKISPFDFDELCPRGGKYLFGKVEVVRDFSVAIGEAIAE